MTVQKSNLTIRNTSFTWGTQVYVMGIINVTTDSFSGDGTLVTEGDWCEVSCAQGEQFVRDGAHILDVGGESTRPGSVPVSTEEELARVLPVISALATRVTVPISIDTIKPEVARQALQAGASILNTVADVRITPQLLQVAHEFGVPIIITHNRSNEKNLHIDPQLGGRYEGIVYTDVVADVGAYLLELVQLGLAVGIPHEHIILDPGIGFGKTTEQNLQLIKYLEHITNMGYPVLVGPSRKSFLGYKLNLPKEERLEATIAAAVLSAERGADIVRVHDVKAVVRALALTDAVLRV